MSSTEAKFKTIIGRKTFNQLGGLSTYEELDPIKNAIKQAHLGTSVWKYIDSGESTIWLASQEQPHIIKLDKTMGRIGDLYLQVLVPANTYVAHLLGSAIKEIKFTSGDFDVHYSGEDIDMLLAHLNDATHATKKFNDEGNITTAVAASTWYSIPIWFVGSKLLYTMSSSIDDPQNYSFPLYKLVNDLTIKITFNTYAKFITTGTNTTGLVRLRYKQYDYLDSTFIPNNGMGTTESTFIVPYFYNMLYSISLTDAQVTSQTIDQQKDEGEMTELLIKIATNANYQATAPLLYTTEGIDKLEFTLGSDYIYQALSSRDIGDQYYNEYLHPNTLDLATVSKNFYVLDFSESPMLLHNGSLDGPGLIFGSSSPVLKITPTSNLLSSTASTLYSLAIFKCIYKIDKYGKFSKITKLQ